MWSTKYEKVPEGGEKLNYTPPGPFLAERHNCTDPICVVFFFLCLGFYGYIMSYALQNGDPRKVYHGMDGQGQLCGVDLPTKPYVFWCQSESGANVTVSHPVAGEVAIPIKALDLAHPVCVETCPFSVATQTMCFSKASGNYQLKEDYSTHAVAHRYCLPQSEALLEQFNNKMDEHPANKYFESAIGEIRNGWKVLCAVAGVAFILSMLYLLLIECMAGCLIWSCLACLVVLPGAAGGYLIYADSHGGLDGMPSSGDSGTDLKLGIACCVVAALFFCVCTCMHKAVSKAIEVVKASADCMFSCRSLLLEPILNLTARVGFWLLTAAGFVYLVSVGEVRKSKIYRTFTYTDEQQIYIAFAIFMWIWLNDFITAVSQYAIANASARWYFTEHSGGTKKIGSCLLCQGYCNVIFHIGSLAFGSLIIAFTRPLRILMVVVVFAGEMSGNNPVCRCISGACACCLGCFESTLQHLCKNAFIDMAITSKSFCAAGSNAAKLLSPKNNAGAAAALANVGATWIFTLSGLTFVTTVGAMITSYVMVNVEIFNTPSSKHYVADPMVMTFIGGAICFFVSMCVMLVFDAVSDSLFLCLAYDQMELKNNPVPVWKAPPKAPPQSAFASMFSSQAPEPKAPTPARRPQFAHPPLEAMNSQRAQVSH